MAKPPPIPNQGPNGGSTQLHVEIASRAVWETHLEKAMADLPAPQRDMLPAILETMHDRHCAIPVTLAAELVPILSEAGHPPSKKRRGWGDVYARLQRELRATGTPDGVGMGLLLNADPPYTLFRLVEPILRMAARRLGHVVLLCADKEGGVSDTDYNNWSAKFAGAVGEVASDLGDPERNLFWRERASALAARSRHAALGSLHLPEATPYERATFYRTEAEPGQPAEPVARLAPRHASTELRGSAEEEGFDGIKISRGLDRITSMLHTEYLNHPAVLADRIINTGYFAFKRFARRESARHVFLSAAQPPILHEHPLAPFVKSCWFEFTVRASHLLARSALARSSLRWAEGDALGRVRSLDRDLADLPQAARSQKEISAFRRHFTHDLQWLPDWLADRGGLALELPDEPDALQATANWMRPAWVGDRETRELDQYGLVFLMVMVPTSLRDRLGGAAFAETLRAALGFQPNDGTALAITWIPDAIDEFERWDVVEADAPGRVRLRPTEAGDTAKNIATWLQERWMIGFRKELARG